CGNCSRFCPYKVIFMVEPPKPKQSMWSSFTHILDFLRPHKAEEHAGGHQHIATKCDLCFDVDGGPACVRNCPTGAAIRVKPEFFKTVEFHN
ncbi:MAG: 4Fe-4S dicluster domain-containing protein, partial [Candidatus Tectomicrobia bacterium]|nr:4Fe-4S dicluster domain-containing protein [Candidatus Tectomicrobia bacterium]